MRHPGITLGYRIEADGQSLAYVPDHQQPDGESPIDAGVLDLCDGVDVLVHDAQYTDLELSHKPTGAIRRSTSRSAWPLPPGSAASGAFPPRPLPRRRDARRNAGAARALGVTRGRDCVLVALEGTTVECRPASRAPRWRYPRPRAELLPSPEIEGVVIVEPVVHADERGTFVEFWRQEWLPGVPEVVQANRSDKVAGSVVGLHYHLYQADYWYAVAGRARVVLHDLRRTSPTEGATLAVELEGSGHRAVYVPPGVAHGFAALQPISSSSTSWTATTTPETSSGWRGTTPSSGSTGGVDRSGALGP